MDVDQALRLLARLREAAPPATASRITDVIGLVETLGMSQNGGSHHEPAVSAFPPLVTILDQISLQLSNKLHLIEGQTNSLRAGRLGRMTTEQIDALKLVVEYAASGTELLRMTRQIAALQAGTFALDILVFNPLDVAAEAWQRTFPQADAREHQFAILADNPLPYVRGDYQQILDILLSMIDNAIRYMPIGGEIKLTVNTLGTHLLFSVADSGIGLSPEDHAHVGEPFWRATHQTLVKQHPGSGLHLYVAREILRLMDGEFFFSGEPDVGSTFSFTLPADMD